MILNEKPLVKRMVKDWNGDGYTVAGLLVEGDPWLAIEGNGYVAAVERSNAPRKVLAAIAEHAGDLPGTGHSWLVQKGSETQMADTEFVEATIRKLLDQEPETGLMVCCRLAMDRRRLWQNTASGEIWLMNPEKTNIADAPASSIEPVGPWIRFRGTISVACVCRENADEADGKLLEHLKKAWWI